MSNEFKSIREALLGLLKKYNLESIIEYDELLSNLETIVGKEIASQIKVKELKDGDLIIEVESAAWKNEISMLREEIREKINSHFKKEIIKQIRIY